MKEKMVCVEWNDASFNQGYYDKREPENFGQIRTRTVGHLVTKSGKDILVSQDRFYCPDGHIESDRHITTIPKKMVKKITYLKE